MATKAPVEDATPKGEQPKKPGTELVHWKDKMVALTKKTQEAEKPQGGFISFKGGRMTYNEQMIPGDAIRAVIVDYRFDFEFYEGAYDPKKVQSPVCYAITAPGDPVTPWRQFKDGDDKSKYTVREQDGVIWLSQAEKPQVNPGFDCESCPQFEWGSAPPDRDGKPSKGKACKTSRRLHVIAADDLGSPESVRKASVMSMIPPATSVENFQLIMNQIGSVLDSPMFGAVVEISVRPHDRFQFMVHFKLVDKIEREDILEALYYKHETVAAREIGYLKNSERDGSSPDPRQQSSKY